MDDYLETCEEMGWEPHKPYKGVFNVRISKEEHRAAAISAFRQGYASLNEFVREAIQEKIQREETEKPVVDQDSSVRGGAKAEKAAKGKSSKKSGAMKNAA